MDWIIRPFVPGLVFTVDDGSKSGRGCRLHRYWFVRTAHTLRTYLLTWLITTLRWCRLVSHTTGSTLTVSVAAATYFQMPLGTYNKIMVVPVVRTNEPRIVTHPFWPTASPNYHIRSTVESWFVWPIRFVVWSFCCIDETIETDNTHCYRRTLLQQWHNPYSMIHYNNNETMHYGGCTIRWPFTFVRVVRPKV